VSDRFWIEQDATHMVISFDLSRPLDDRSSHEAVGEIWFDDIQLSATHESIPRRYARAEGSGHPLELELELPSPLHRGAREMRKALHAPAPSVLSFPVEVPEQGVLSVGYALTPAAHTRAEENPVSFEVELVTSEGERITLYRDARPWAGSDASAWHDAEVELDRFAGTQVVLNLVTRGRPAPPGAPTLERLPEAGMVWSEPLLTSRAGAGRTAVLVVFDTVSARHTSLHGYERPTTPRLQALAERGVAFERALSPSPWTLPAFASLLTGLEPAEHRAGQPADGHPNGRRSLGPAFVTVAEQLRQAGWETLAWINNPYLMRAYGLDQGFSVYVDYGTRSSENASQEAVSDVVRQLSASRGHDRFFFVHLMDPHGPYLPNPSFERRFLERTGDGVIRSQRDFELFRSVVMHQMDLTSEERAAYREPYDAVLAYADSQLGRIVEAFRSNEAPSRSLLIATADHGEEFWEHGTYEHGHTLYGELLRVPLVVRAPGLAVEGQRVSEPVSLRDVAPTLLEFAGLEPPGNGSASSLLPKLSGAGTPSPRALHASGLLYGIDRYAIEREGYKYIYNASGSGSGSPRSPRPEWSHELYDLARDPDETSNRFREELGRGLSLHDELAAYVAHTLSGAYLVQLDSGRTQEKLGGEWTGTLSVGSGARWKRRVWDFIWPHADGRPGTLSLAHQKRGDRSVIRFSVAADRALLGFRLEGSDAPVNAQLELDGRPLPMESIVLGRDGSHPDAGTFPVPGGPGDRVPAAEFVSRVLEGPRDAQPRVRLLRLLDPLDSDVGDGEADERLEQQLRALGYLE
jgi:arylsulfatase A-like enzyme